MGINLKKNQLFTLTVKLNEDGKSVIPKTFTFFCDETDAVRIANRLIAKKCKVEGFKGFINFDKFVDGFFGELKTPKGGRLEIFLTKSTFCAI